MNVNPYNTTDYENIANWTLGENKPNTKPIKPNLVRHSLGEGGTNPTCRGALSGDLSGVALAKTEALAKADSKGAPVLRKRFLQKLLSAVLSGVALAKTEALAKADAHSVRKLALILLSE